MKQITHIKEIGNFKDLANMLNIRTGYLTKILNNDKRYKSFKIKKKNGDERSIYAPRKELLVIQLRLKELLEKSFNAHHKSFGFVKEKDFILNAKNHINQKYILNIDLKNFFESISSKRVNNMFQRYFKINSSVATVLTKICCHPNGFLPQGAPTSPIISNIICKSLDKELYNLVKYIRLTNYSRYADDITFSSKKILPKSLIEDDVPTLSKTLIKIIESHGFEINPQKTRLQSNLMHQEVTGITVNKKLNINRRYIKNIRAILYSFKKDYKNPEVPLELFCEKNNLPFDELEKVKFKVFNILKGRIMYIAQVKGYADSIFQDFMKKFNELIELYNIRVQSIQIKNDPYEFYKNNTFVIDSLNSNGSIYITPDSFDNIYCEQGTGFYLKDIGVVTNYHVIKPIIDSTINKEGYFNKDYYLEIFLEQDNKQIAIDSKIVCYDKVKDIAILELDPKTSIEKLQGFTYNERFNRNDDIKLIGFPQHRIGSELRVEKGIVSRKICNTDRPTFEILQARVFEGNSGGPIVNRKNEVIGVATIGESNGETITSQFVPIKHAIKIFKEKRNH